MTHINSEDEQDVLLFKASELGNNLFYDKRELKNLSMKVKEESEKADLKLNIQKMKIMTFSPII